MIGKEAQKLNFYKLPLIPNIKDFYFIFSNHMNNSNFQNQNIFKYFEFFLKKGFSTRL